MPVEIGADGERRRQKKAEQRAREKSMSPKQIRARARRNGGLEKASDEEKKALLSKPLEQWDLEELARGRPRDKNGQFRGPAPQWISREIHEKALDLFKDSVRTNMRSLTVKSLEVLEDILENDELDEKGKPAVPAGTKVDIAKFLVEHLIGKPTQPIQQDISLKLQGILGAVLVQPEALEAGGLVPSSSHRDVVEGEVVEDEEDDDDE